MLRGVIFGIGMAIGMMAMPIATAAQGQPISNTSVLIIDSERLYAESLFGKRANAEIQAETAVLAAENRRIAAELTEEERALTKQRPDMSPEDFRRVADAFDERVEGIRNEQQQREVDLVQTREAERQRFFSNLEPVLETVLSDSGAVVLLEKRSVFASSNALDVTDQVIAQADLILGDGAAEDADTETEKPAENSAEEN